MHREEQPVWWRVFSDLSNEELLNIWQYFTQRKMGWERKVKIGDVEMS